MVMSGLAFSHNDIAEIVYVHQMHHYWPVHNHPGVYQIILVFAGKLEIGFDEMCVTLGADDFVVIPPLKTHIERAVEPIQVLTISVSEMVVRENGIKALDTLDTIIETLLTNGLIEIHHIVTLIKAASQIITLHRNQSDNCSAFVAQSREILEKWPEKDISMDEMADAVKTCCGHLNRVFKKQVGLTPHQYQIQNRVRKASLLLVDTDMTTSEICKTCGFYDKSHFKRHFKRSLGMSPHEYRMVFKQAKQLIL